MSSIAIHNNATNVLKTVTVKLKTDAKGIDMTP